MSTLCINLPSWLDSYTQENPVVFTTLEERMLFVLGLAQRNILEKSGGPFGAAIFEKQSGRLLSAGVNLVEHTNCSHAHAEMIAIALAEQKLQTYSLNNYELVTSCEPCAMCLGAIVWSGISHVCSAATDEDARALGFDEGPKPNNWINELNLRHISVTDKLLRDKAQELFQLYQNQQGTIYNPQRER